MSHNINSEWPRTVSCTTTKPNVMQMIALIIKIYESE